MKYVIDFPLWFSSVRVLGMKWERRAIYFWYLFLRQVLELVLGSWFYAFLLLCFSASLLFLLLCFSCFSAFPACLLYLLLCLPCFSAFLLLCFTCFFSFLLLCFPCFSAFLLLCFCAFPLLLFSFFFSSVMCFCCSYFLLLSFSTSCLYCLFVFSFLLLYSLLFVNTLGETQRNLNEMLIRTPDKKTYMKP